MTFDLNDGSQTSPGTSGSVDLSALENLVVNRRESLEDQVVSAFEQWRDAIYRYLTLAGSVPAEAEEITQECFVRLFQALHAGTTVEHTQRWLFRVAHNLLVDHSRRPQPPRSSAAKSLQAVEARPDPRPNPEQRVLLEERLEQIHQALGGLTTLQQNCIHLRAEGLLHREIAEILGISMDSVADALRRGLTRLSRHRK